MSKWHCLVILVLLTFDAVADDPCADEPDRFTCIEALISIEKAKALDRINQLNSTPGNKGATGARGVRGDTGPRGKDYEDFNTFVTNQVTEKASDWFSRYKDTISESRLGPLRTDADGLATKLSELENRYSNVNRNLTLINTANLHFPRTAFVNTLKSFRSVFNGQDCLVTPTAGGEQGTANCTSTAASNNIYWICRAKYPPLGAINTALYQPEICDLVKSGSVTISLTELGDFTDKRVLEEYFQLPEKFTIVVSSINERASYKLGMDPQNAVYLLALDRILAEIADPNVSAEIIGLMTSARAEIDTNYIEGVDQAILLVESLADTNAGLRRERLGTYIQGNELLYYLLVTVVSELFTDYLTDPTFVATLSDEQIADFQKMDTSFVAFATLFLERWKALAIEERDTHSHGPYKYELAAKPINHVDAAAVRLAEEFEYQQSELLESFVADVATGTVFAGATTTLVASGFIASAAFAAVAGTTSAASVGSILAATAATSTWTAIGLSTSVSVLGTAGTVALIAGPVAVAIGAIAVGIKFVIDLDKEAQYKKIFDNLQETTITQSTDVLQLGYKASGGDEYTGKEVLANMIFAWLMVNAPAGIQ